MKRLSNLLTELTTYGIEPEIVQAGLPELGSDLAMPCFSLAKRQGVPPQQIAEQIASKLNHAHVERAEAVSGYVNLWLSSKFLADRLSAWQAEQENLGQREPNGQLVIIDFFSPNLAKPISIGHMRNLFQGRALRNLHLILGYDVVTDNHIGDWGTAFGTWVVGFLKYSDEKKLNEAGLEELGRVYILISQDLKQEAAEAQTALSDQVQGWLIKLEQGDKEAWRYHELFSHISMRAMDRILAELGVEFEEALGESFYHAKALELLKDLESRNIAERQTDGSLIVSLESEGISIPLLIQKSNGATLYATTDIATMDYRQKRWQPKKVIYVVGMEQQLHFKQLFAFNRIANLTPAELIHHAYGLIEERTAAGKKQKMSSRTGAIHLEDTLHKAYETVENLIQKQLIPADIKKIAQGALVFQEFSQSKKHNILFDWDRVFSLSDASGPYVQYATLRLKSILQKVEGDFQPDPAYDWQSEHRLIIKVLSFEDVLDGAATNLELSRVALHVFELCKELNRYYENTRILDDKASGRRSSRLWLMEVIYRHLCFALGVLGIEIPSKM